MSMVGIRPFPKDEICIDFNSKTRYGLFDNLKKEANDTHQRVVLSLGVQCLCICICILLSRAMNIEVSALVYFVVFPLVTLLTILPVSFNGIGIREGGFVYFLGLYGVLPSYALMLSICFFVFRYWRVL